LNRNKKNDSFSKKTNGALERYNGISTRQFKQTSDKLAALEKLIEDKLKAWENNVNLSLKNMKDALNRTISSFEMQIKDVLADNRVMSEKVKNIAITNDETTKTVAKMHTDLIDEIKSNKIDLNNTISSRIEKIVANNLMIPGLIDDPECWKKDIQNFRTLKDYILNDVSKKSNLDESIKVNYLIKSFI